VFLSPFTWKLNTILPSTFQIRLVFGSINPITALDGVFSNYFKKEIALSTGELLYGDEPDIEFTLGEYTLKLHSSLMELSPTENSTLKAHLKYRWEHKSSKSLKIYEGEHITVDVLKSFISFLYEDIVDDQEYEDHALGLLVNTI
jgi:hypothetical protein